MTKSASASANAAPRMLSYVYLHRLHRFSKLKISSEKFNNKHRPALDAGLKDVKKDSWTAVPSVVWHFCGMKYYEHRVLSANGKLALLAPKIANEGKLSSFVEKQVDTKNLSFFQKAARYAKSFAIGGSAWVGATAVFAVVLAELAHAASTIVSGFREPVAIAITICIAAVSAGLGYIARFKIDRARDMLAIGREKAEKLADEVRNW